MVLEKPFIVRQHTSHKRKSSWKATLNRHHQSTGNQGIAFLNSPCLMVEWNKTRRIPFSPDKSWWYTRAGVECEWPGRCTFLCMCMAWLLRLLCTAFVYGGVYGEKIYLMVLMFENCWRQEARVALMNFGGLCGWWAPASLLSVLFLFYFLLKKPLSFSHHQFAEEHTHLSKATPNHPSTSATKRTSNLQIAKRGLITKWWQDVCCISVFSSLFSHKGWLSFLKTRLNLSLSSLQK